jgi:LytS/YehU family sensor histidine kinase
LHSAQSQASHSEGELRLLQSQLSPHFLFNTLNNMYGISLTQVDKIPNLLLRLAELLRYSVYDTKALFVPLREELAYIKNYVEFERIRIGNKLVLSQNLDETSIDHLKIAPMLLIVFVENAFKHSRSSTDGPVFIDIGLKQWGRSILFSVKNSVGQPLDTLSAENNRGGLGLPNVWRRLELIYPNKYDLNIQEDSGYYEVLLRLNL